MRVLLLVLMLALPGCRYEEEMLAKQNASDGVTCKSYGLQYGTQPYAQCRLTLLQMRQAQDAQAAARLQQTLGQIQQNYAASKPLTVNCTSNGTATASTSFCTSQ